MTLGNNITEGKCIIWKMKVEKTRYKPVCWCWSKLWNIYSCPLTNMKRASGGVQKSVVLWGLFLSGVADIHDESFGFFWLLGNVRFFPFRLRLSTHEVPSPYNSTERDGAVLQALSLPHKQTLQDILRQHHNGGYGTATWLLATILLSALWTDLGRKSTMEIHLGRKTTSGLSGGHQGGVRREWPTQDGRV